MARSLTPNTQQFLDERTKFFVSCWEIRPVGREPLRFTDCGSVVHIRPTGYPAWVTFRPRGGFTPSAADAASGLYPSSQEFLGAIRADAVTDEDLRSGVYEGAEVRRWVVDSRYPFGGAVSYDRYWIDGVTFDSGSWRANVEGLSRFLAATVDRRHTRQCPYSLGSAFGDSAHAGCKVNVADFTDFGKSVTAVDATAPRERFQISTAQADGFFAYGSIVWQSGDNRGVRSEIENNASGGWITLQEPTPKDIATSVVLDVTAGCDWTYSTCREKFSNGANFGGDPYILSEDGTRRGPVQ